MAVDTNKYRPLLFSELVAGRDIDKDGDLDFTLCRASALAMGFDAATNGEWTTNANGSKWGRGKIRNALERMRAATGDLDREGYNQSHMDDFLRGVKAPVEAYERFNKPMSAIKGALGQGYVVFLAGNVSKTPAGSTLRRYVNEWPHEIILTRINKDGTKIAFIDPMTPHGTVRYERWAPANDVRLFGTAFSDAEDNMIAGKMRRGMYTDAKEVARDRARVIKRLQTDLLELQALWKQQQRELDDQDETIESLRTRLDTARTRIEELEQLGGHDHLGLADKVGAVRSELESIEAELRA